MIRPNRLTTLRSCATLLLAIICLCWNEHPVVEGYANAYNKYMMSNTPAFVPPQQQQQQHDSQQPQQQAAAAAPATTPQPPPRSSFSNGEQQEQEQAKQLQSDDPYAAMNANAAAQQQQHHHHHQAFLSSGPTSAFARTTSGAPSASASTATSTRTSTSSTAPQIAAPTEKGSGSDGVVGEKFVLGTNPKTSSGKSAIYEAIPHDTNTGQPIPGEAPVVVKLSSNAEALEREAQNYERIVSKNKEKAKGLFVEVHDFLEQADPNCDELKGQAALVMERGELDLQTYIQTHGPLQGKQLKEAMRTVARCVRAIHASKMVWTELKGANFVITNEKETTIGAGNDVVLNIKAIDLESAVPKNNNPIDFSPEACPPEFAMEFLCGREPHMEMKKSFDIWSMGILFYKMATGKAYFNTEVKDRLAIALALKNAAAGVMDQNQNQNQAENERAASLDLDKHGDIDQIVDEPLKDLISWCLAIDPKARPKIGDVFHHRYFVC